MPAEDYTQNTQPPAPHRLTVPESCAGLRLDQALARLLPRYSRARLSTWIREGRVCVDGRTPAPRDRLHGGERIEVRPALSPEETAFRPETIPLDIVYEDDTLIVIDKPPGLVVHPGSGNWQGTLLNALLAHAPQLAAIPRAGIVHRLDKDTSGLLVIAKTLTAQTDLVRQLQARTVSREYRAVVHGRVVRSGTMEGPVGRDPRSRIRMAVVPSGKPAVTHYAVTEKLPRATVLACRLETGRTHQIRVHLQKLGHPIWGDPVYGPRAPAPPRFPRQALHAEKLALIHPETGKTMQWQAPLPADMRQLIETLRAA
ncbi:MAG: 23S rRNA pseudouridine(1911/1915/1917) synthase RluD [Burkholderiales bacterium]|nr:23S rRNA pseudouridine(1911/1915/1917) synthase RluD [Burkholderiales bacterium]